MKILLFSDIHSSQKSLTRILAQPADLFIDAGDLVSFQKGLIECGEALNSLGNRLWVLPGNHETHDDTRSLCERFGFVDFHRQVHTLASAAGPTYWAGLGYSNITPFITAFSRWFRFLLAFKFCFFFADSGAASMSHCETQNPKMDLRYVPRDAPSSDWRSKAISMALGTHRRASLAGAAFDPNTPQRLFKELPESTLRAYIPR